MRTASYPSVGKGRQFIAASALRSGVCLQLSPKLTSLRFLHQGFEFMQLQELINFMCTFPRIHTDCMLYIPAYNARSYAFAIVVQINIMHVCTHSQKG